MKLSEEYCLSENSFYMDYVCCVWRCLVENPVSWYYCEALNCKECVNPKGHCHNCRKDYMESQMIPRIVRNDLQRLKFKCPLCCSQ